MKIQLRDLTFSAMFTALISILGYLSIKLPFSPVPITGQTFGIILAGLTLTTLQASLSVSVFILIGIAGIPVFSGGTAGLPVLSSARGGYIIGFLAAAIVITLIRRQSNNAVRMTIAGFVGGMLTVYAFGALWLVCAHKLTFSGAFLSGVLPYIPFDLLKLFLAVSIALPVNKQMKAVFARV